MLSMYMYTYVGLYSSLLQNLYIYIEKQNELCNVLPDLVLDFARFLTIESGSLSITTVIIKMGVF